MVEVLGTVWSQVVGCPEMGGPVIPPTRVLLPVRSPLDFPVEGMVTSESMVQLTGTSLAKKKITGCVASELHSTIEARAPGANPVPDTLMTSPAATPLHTGAVGLVSLHVAPAAVVASDNVVDDVDTAADALEAKLS